MSGHGACVLVALVEEIERFDPVGRDVKRVGDLSFFERFFGEADVARVVLDEQDVRRVIGIVVVTHCARRRQAV